MENRGRSSGEWASTIALVALFLVLPFEPVRPTLPFLVGRLSLLEAAAGVATGVLLWTGRHRLLELVGARPPWPLLFLWTFAAANLLSAAFAGDHSTAAARFALRTVAAAVFATAVAVTPISAHVQALAALVASTTGVALLALLEAVGLRALDSFLDQFRDAWVVVGMTRRATGGSAHPNLAGALLAAGLVTAAALGVRRAEHRRSSWKGTCARTLPLASLLSLGLHATYSRGGLLAAGVGLATLACVHASRNRLLSVSPLCALAALGSTAALLASDDSALRLRLTTQTSSWYGARYETLAAPAVLEAGTVSPAAVRVTNTGQRTWSRASGIRIGYRLLDRNGAFVAVAFGPALPHDLHTGESAVFDVQVSAPANRNCHVLVWDMAQPGVDWFSRLGAAPGVVSVSGEGGPAPAAARAIHPPEIWRPSRKELWALALAMWRDHPLLGVGPDNFRKLAGRYAGREGDWDARTFANNTCLEAAATVGIAGLIALVGVFLGVFIACGHALRRELSDSSSLAAACLALAAAMAVHGLVDHVLAFTAHYLLLAFTAGVASALAMDKDPSVR